MRSLLFTLVLVVGCGGNDFTANTESAGAAGVAGTTGTQGGSAGTMGGSAGTMGGASGTAGMNQGGSAGSSGTSGSAGASGGTAGDAGTSGAAGSSGTGGTSMGGSSGTGGGSSGTGGAGGSAGGGCDVMMLKINEVQTNGSTGLLMDVFVELYNPNSCAIDVTGYKLFYRLMTGTSDNSLVWEAYSGQQFGPGQHFVIGGTEYSYGTPDATMTNGLSLMYQGGGLGLKRGGMLVDMVGWGNANNAYVDGAPASAPAMGKSIARHPDGKDTDQNKTDFTEGTSTPGTANL